MGKVVIISNSGDVHSDLLVDACDRLKVGCFRYNTDLFRVNGSVTWEVSDGGEFSIGRHSVRCSDIDLLIYRRPKPVFGQRTDVDKWLGWLYDQEWASIETSLTEQISCPVVNHPKSSFYGQNKLAQLKAAKRNGLRCPKTLVSNSRPALEEFLSKTECVSKAIFNCASQFQGTIHTGKTVRVSMEDLKGYDPSYCPMLLQQRIDCAAMWRIVVVGQKTFGFRLYGSQLDHEIDSRLVESDLDGALVEVPEEVREGLLGTCSDFGLQYASSDFIEDKSGELWFVDLNPDGQWGAYERQFEAPISNEIVNLRRKTSRS